MGEAARLIDGPIEQLMIPSGRETEALPGGSLLGYLERRQRLDVQDGQQEPIRLGPAR